MSDRLKRAYRQAEDHMSSMMQEMHERGELRHLHGKPLDLREDDPAWLVTRMLKQEGFSHPLLERRREVEQQMQAADALVDRLQQRRERLVDQQSSTAPDVADAFNRGRRLALEDYQAHVVELNRTIRDYNLTVPTALQISPVQIDFQMQRVEELVPPLELKNFRSEHGDESWWTRLRRGNRREKFSQRA